MTIINQSTGTFMRYHSAPLSVRLAVILLCMHFMGETGNAQSQPVIATRQRLADELNLFLRANRHATTTVPFLFSDAPGGIGSDDLVLDDALNGCSPVYDLNGDFKIDFDFSTAGKFTMSRVLRSSGQHSVGDLDLGPNDHELVADLNAWLNASWALDLKGVPEFDALGFTCAGSPGNRFYTQQDAASALVEKIRELTGESEIWEKEYDIAGQILQGKDFLKFHPGGTRVVRYMTDRGDMSLPAEQRDTVRYLGNVYLEIDMPGGAPWEFKFDLVMQTSYYPSGNCGLSVSTPSSDGLTAVDVDLKINDQSVQGDCEFGWFCLGDCKVRDGNNVVIRDLIAEGYTDDPDVASDKVFWYLEDHRGDWIYNNQGEQYPISGLPFEENELLHRIKQLGAFRISDQGLFQMVLYRSGCCWFHEFTIGTLVDDPQPYSQEECRASYCSPLFTENPPGTIDTWEGEFVLDADYKMLYYIPPVSTCEECARAPVVCMQFCDSAKPAAPIIVGVIGTNARRFTDRVPLLDEAEFSGNNPKEAPLPWWNTNQFERGMRGKWRSHQEYIFRSSIKPGTGLFVGSTPTERNYNDAGRYDLKAFNWRIPAANDHPTGGTWLNPAAVTRFAQNGEPVEEVNIYGIPSCAHFGYREQMPVAVAKNATYGSVAFESFEDGKGNDTEHSHSGDYSLRLDYDDWDVNLDQDPYIEWHAPTLAVFTVDDYALSTDDLSQDERDYGGLIIRFWARQYVPTDPASTVLDPPVDIRFSRADVGTVVKTVPASAIEFVAISGEWALYQTVVDDLPLSELGKILKVQIKAAQMTIGGHAMEIHVDDFRMQPVKSDMMCYVYDPDNLRQVAAFDDQHFGMFFQYNGEGKLIRRLRETERGVKTMVETQYHNPFVQRDYAQSVVTFGTRPGSSGAGGGTGGGAGRTDQGGLPDGATFDILDIEIGPEGHDIKLFNEDVDDIPAKLKRLRDLLTIPSFEGIDLPEIDKLRLMDELLEVERALDSLRRIDSAAGRHIQEIEGRIDTPEGEAGRTQSRVRVDSAEWSKAEERIVKRRGEIMKRLGLPEEEIDSLIRKAKDMRNDVESGDPEQEIRDRVDPRKKLDELKEKDIEIDESFKHESERRDK